MKARRSKGLVAASVREGRQGLAQSQTGGLWSFAIHLKHGARHNSIQYLVPPPFPIFFYTPQLDCFRLSFDRVLLISVFLFLFSLSLFVSIRSFRYNHLDMAIDALKNLVNNVPGWLKRKHNEEYGDITQNHTRKKPKLLSIMSTEDAPTAYRTRSRIIIYYNGCIQGFFKELIKFVLLSQNLRRKAKTAARVAQIKKLAEQDILEDGSNNVTLPLL